MSRSTEPSDEGRNEARRHCFALSGAVASLRRALVGEPSRGGTPQRRGSGENLRRGVLYEARAPRPILNRLRLMAALLAIATAGLLAAAWVALRNLDDQIARAEAVSVTVLDRNDRLLRAFTTPDDSRWRLPVTADAVDPRYLAMLRAYEDRRFHRHAGVDWLALARAAGQLARNGRIVSGGSTLSMQVARLLDGEHPRTAPGKLRQIVRALELERRHGKKEIVRLYLRLAPFGGNLEGVRAASLAYFGKEPRRLSVAEAALLVALPQSPETRRPDRHPEIARIARDRVIERARAAGVIGADEAADALRDPVPRARREFPKLAPHLAETELRRDSSALVHRLTLDRDAQARLETLAREQAQALGSKLSVAILAVEHATGEVIAHVGSAGYLDEDRLGAIDMTDAVRSPGSTLKPLVYGLAFEQGLAHPETLIEDRPARFGVYAPKNFDEGYRGTVTVREALAESLNIPAVKVLAAVGPARMAGRLRRIGLTTALPARTEPTLAIALGGLGMKLSDLATLYAALARGGEAVPLTWRRESREAARGPAVRPRLLSSVASWYVADILKDAPPPAGARSGLIAYKTGTSYGYRDAWAAGFDGRYTVAVWVGRPDGSAIPGLTGRGAAAPVLFDAMARLSERPTPLASPPRGVIRLSTAALPVSLRRFRDPGSDGETTGPWLDPPVAIAFPPDRSVLETDPGEDAPIMLKASGGALPLTWLVDGAPLEGDPARREALWQPSGQGFTRITVIDAKGRTDLVEVRVK
jgi:penicillin-binding protein 1C